MGNKKYNIDDTRKISGVVNVPTSGNSIIYPKIDDNWYIMGSDGIEFRLSKDIDFGDGFTITSGFEPYGSKVDVSIGLGLRFDIDGKIEVNVDEFTSIIVGDKFIEKTDFLVHNFVGSGSDVIIPLLANGASEIRLQSGLTPLISIDGFDLSLITGNPDAKVPYNGKIFLIHNTSSTPITLKSSSNVDFKFHSLSGTDVVIPVNGIITVKYGSGGGGESAFTEYFRNWTESEVLTVVSLDPPSGIPVDGQQWIQYEA